MAIIPGKITRNGKNIFGNAAINGVRRAADIEFEAMARCTTRKSVHQYPKLNTKPNPMTRPNHSTPNGFCAALPMCAHDWDNAPGAYPCAVDAVCKRCCNPDHPPTS